MKVILFLSAVFLLMCSIAIMAYSKGALHEIEAFILLAASAVSCGSASIIEAIHKSTSDSNISSQAIVDAIEANKS